MVLPEHGRKMGSTGKTVELRGLSFNSQEYCWGGCSWKQVRWFKRLFVQSMSHPQVFALGHDINRV